MDPDLFMVIGLVLIGLAALSLISAFTDGRMPRAAAVMMIAATILIALAVSKRPGGYAWEDVPGAFVRVIARVVN